MIKLIAYSKMRYQKEIEAILKISEEFGSKVLTQNVLCWAG